MKNGLLICTGEGKRKNIGDYIQSVSQEQFFDHIDNYVEREKLDTYDSKEKTNVIMNAWFMWHPENFPPSPSIRPLFISFHIVPSIAERLLTQRTISYLKKYEPIGTRDLGTKEMLESKGIRSYFSGCLTLTLGLNYKSEKRSDEVIFVDPYYELGWGNGYQKVIRYASAFLLLLWHWKKVASLNNSFATEVRTGFYTHFRTIDRLLCCASFYHYYSKSFSDDFLFNASYLSHSVMQSDFSGDDEKMEYARQLVKRYAQAKLVITSRIHCGLPCIGVETPVIFVTSKRLSEGKHRSGGRFGGLIDLFHVMEWSTKGLEASTHDLKSKIGGSKLTNSFVIENSDKYKSLKDSMIKTINKWLKDE